MTNQHIEKLEREVFDRAAAVNLARDLVADSHAHVTAEDLEILCEAILTIDAALLSSDAPAGGEPESFEQWNAKQHGDPEEIGFLQALRIAYICGQDSVYRTHPQPQAVPLTPEQLQTMWLQTINRTDSKRLPNEVYFARAIESAHGIGKPV